MLQPMLKKLAPAIGRFLFRILIIFFVKLVNFCNITKNCFFMHTYFLKNVVEFSHEIKATYVDNLHIWAGHALKLKA